MMHFVIALKISASIQSISNTVKDQYQLSNVMFHSLATKYSVLYTIWTHRVLGWNVIKLKGD